eukprot:TRINITY_DN2557_c0_g1_i2.p2 TRINITY_DN2557_c0_g1~~TRINITY_DN2557_c0_g1_i2.p2  ORF type:complete len:162 (-),score=36.69 TRINITY_DN2557_c0_g1_i2:64-486(-)
MSQGGLYRTDGGVRVSSGLDVSDPSLAEAYAKVRDDADESTWMVIEYESKSKLRTKAIGAGGPSELLEQITDDAVVFGILRTKEGKFLCLMCSGENAGGMVKGRAAAHKNAAFNTFEGTVGEVCGISKADFEANLEKVDF